MEILIEQVEGSHKTKLKDTKKREETSNQWRIWKIVSRSKLGAAFAAVEITKAGETVKINERKEVEREIMTSLSKIFLLTNDNSTIENDFTSKGRYLAEKEVAEDILRGKIP